MPSPSALRNIRPISQLCYLIVTLHGGCRSPITSHHRPANGD